MQLAFYVARHGTLLDRVTNTLSGRDDFSHVELVFGDGVSFSSSPRDGGVRFKFIIRKPGRWRTVGLHLTPEQELVVREFCRKQVGKKYDWAGVVGMVLPIRRNRRRWFCSELVVAALQKVGLFPHLKPWRISPNTLWLLMPNRG